jgi:lambda family phage portal protein
MNLLDRMIAAVSPQRALSRIRARVALDVMMNYHAATNGKRGASWRRTSADADAASGKRQVLAFVARDMVRNTPFATRAQAVIANNVVGDGIIWKLQSGAKRGPEALRRVLKAHFDTTAIDADGRQNLYGLQRLVMNGIVDSGEMLIRRRRRSRRDGLPLPFQLQVMEPDFIDTTRDGLVAGAGEGNTVREGIEYDGIGRRVAYWLYPEHPGARVRLTGTYVSRRVPASEILHIYRQDRAGQMRGVTWFAPVALAMQDMADAQDAQIMRQKIAACFAAFRTSPEDEQVGDPANRNAAGQDDPAGLSSMIPGRIQNLRPGEDIKFSAPPAVDGYDEFTRNVLRSAAAGLGMTYEALTGDLSRVNFSSARMGRMEMDRNVSAWQWLMMIPQMMQPIADWTMEAIDVAGDIRRPKGVELVWVPPHRMLVDPAREIPALADKVRAGFASRQGVVRELGYDPEELLEEQIEDRAVCAVHDLRFDSDVHFGTGAPAVLPDPDDDQDDGGKPAPGKGDENDGQ